MIRARYAPGAAHLVVAPRSAAVLPHDVPPELLEQVWGALNPEAEDMDVEVAISLLSGVPAFALIVGADEGVRIAIRGDLVAHISGDAIDPETLTSASMSQPAGGDSAPDAESAPDVRLVPGAQLVEFSLGWSAPEPTLPLAAGVALVSHVSLTIVDGVSAAAPRDVAPRDSSVVSHGAESPAAAGAVESPAAAEDVESPADAEGDVESPADAGVEAPSAAAESTETAETPVLVDEAEPFAGSEHGEDSAAAAPDLGPAGVGAAPGAAVPDEDVDAVAPDEAPDVAVTAEDHVAAAPDEHQDAPVPDERQDAPAVGTTQDDAVAPEEDATPGAPEEDATAVVSEGDATPAASDDAPAAVASADDPASAASDDAPAPAAEDDDPHLDSADDEAALTDTLAVSRDRRAARDTAARIPSYEVPPRPPLPQTNAADAAAMPLGDHDGETVLPADLRRAREGGDASGAPASDAAASGTAAVVGSTAASPSYGDHDGETIAAHTLASHRARPASAAPQPEPEIHVTAADHLTIDGLPLRDETVTHPRVRVSNGVEVELDRPVIVGRRPRSAREAGANMPHLIAVESPMHDISRNHVEIRLEFDTAMATDLNSTNGTALLRDGDRQRLHPGERTVLIEGDALDLGEGVVVSFEGLP